MERDDTWYKDTWKDRPNSLGYAIGMGDVKLSEAGKKGDNIAIGHSVDDENHVLGFLLIDGFEAFEKSMDDDI